MSNKEPETSESADDFYPGDLATAAQFPKLAQEYHRAAERLREAIKPQDAISTAPFRLSAIHAIELYLNALMRHSGVEAANIRGMQHNLSKRVQPVSELGLRLRKNTAAHLVSLTQKREYLVVRYGPEQTSKTSQINRMEATLNEIAKKVVKLVDRKAA